MYRRIRAFVFSLVLLGTSAAPVQAAGLTMKALVEPVIAGRSMSFQANVADTGSGAVLAPQWDFGDGTQAIGPLVKHTYQKPGVYSVWLSANESHTTRRLAAILRVRDPRVKPPPKVYLDSDARCEADDQHYLGYALFSELDVLGVSSVHNGSGTESINYGEIHYVFRLAKKSGLPADKLPLVFHGADAKLKIPASGKWQDTEPIVTEASEAVLAVARGASPDAPAWILPVGAGTNIASAILQAHQQGFDLKKRIRIIWLGGHANDYHKELHSTGVRHVCGTIRFSRPIHDIIQD